MFNIKMTIEHMQWKYCAYFRKMLCTWNKQIALVMIYQLYGNTIEAGLQVHSGGNTNNVFIRNFAR